MITTKERIISRLRGLSNDDVREIVRAWAISSVRKSKSLRDAIVADGFEPVDVSVGAQYIGDGDELRPVIWVRDSAYALPAEEHRRRRDEAIRAAENVAGPQETRSVAGSESMAPMSCPKCGDSLQHTKVCPACAAGKLGYRHRYTCVCGGVDLISKEAL